MMNHSTKHSTCLLEVSITVQGRYCTKSNATLSYISKRQFQNIPDVKVKLYAGTTTIRLIGVERKIHALSNAALHLCEWSPQAAANLPAVLIHQKGGQVSELV